MPGTTRCTLQIYTINAKITFLNYDIETTFHLKDEWQQQQQKLSSTALLCHEQNRKQISIDGIGSHLY